MTGTAGDTSGGVSLGDTGTAGGSSNGNGSGSGDAGSGAPPAGSGAGAGSGNAETWYSSVKDTALRDFAKSKNWSDPEAALKSHMELEKKFSERPSTPMKPKDIAEYKFTPPADLPKGAYNDEFAGAFKKWAYDADLSTDSAMKLHDSFVGYAKESMAAQAKAHADMMNEKVRTAAKDLEADWGKASTPGFTKNLEMARRAIKSADPGLLDALRDSGVIVQVEGKDMVVNAPIMKALAKMGAGMYAEDEMHEGGGGGDKNPFDDKSTDLAMQGRIMKSDPGKAAALIRAAGKDKMFSQFIARHGK